MSCGTSSEQHAALAHAPRDQLRVLRAEVEHEHRAVVEPPAPAGRTSGVGAHRDIPTPCSRCSFLPSVWSAGANMISAFWKSWIVS